LTVSHDVQYCIDGAVELYRFGGDVAAYLMHYKPNVNEWFDALDESKWSSSRFEKAAVEDFAAWHRTAPADLRAHCNIEGLLALSMQAGELAKSTTQTAIGSLPIGIGVKGLRRIRSDRYLSRIISQDPSTRDVVEIGKSLVANCKMDDLRPDTISTAFDITNRAREKVREEQSRLDRAARKAILGGMTEKRAERSRRRVIRRSLSFLERIIGEDNARIFVSGDRITATGQHFQLIMKKNHRLSTSGHGSLEIEVADSNGIVLSNLCLYLEDTPVMDQVAAFAMDMRSGGEAEIISKGNLYKIRDEAHANARLALLHPRITKEDGGIDRIGLEIPESLRPWHMSCRRSKDEIALLKSMETDIERRSRLIISKRICPAMTAFTQSISTARKHSRGNNGPPN
jgi:hypothetical protein